MERNAAGRLLHMLQLLKDSNVGDVRTNAALSLTGTNIGGLQFSEGTACAYLGLRTLQDAYVEFVSEMHDKYPIAKQKETLLLGLQPLKDSIYAPNLNEKFQTPSQDQFFILDACAKGLPEENEVTRTELDELREGLDTLRVLVTGLKPALRKPLQELIRICEQAVAMYEIRGAAGLKKALKQMWGELAEIWSVEPSDAAEEAEKDTVFQAVRNFMIKVDEVCSKALKYRPLIEAVLPKLLNG